MYMQHVHLSLKVVMLLLPFLVCNAGLQCMSAY